MLSLATHGSFNAWEQSATRLHQVQEDRGVKIISAAWQQGGMNSRAGVGGQTVAAAGEEEREVVWGRTEGEQQQAGGGGGGGAAGGAAEAALQQ